MKPVAAIYSTFLQRAFDQIVHDVCLQNLNVVFAMDRAGLVGDDGPTHHGAFDIAYLRALPNMVLMAPRDEAMLVNMLRTATQSTMGRSRCATRAARPRACRCRRGPSRSRSARGEVLREGERVALLGYGLGVSLALGCRQGARVARARRDGGRRPLRQAARHASLIDSLVADHDLLVTVEDGVLMGGFGSAVGERPARPRPGRRHPDAAPRPAGPLRDPRQARAAAQGGRPHPGRRSPSAWPRRSWTRAPCRAPSGPASAAVLTGTTRSGSPRQPERSGPPVKASRSREEMMRMCVSIVWEKSYRGWRCSWWRRQRELGELRPRGRGGVDRRRSVMPKTIAAQSRPMAAP